LKLLTFPAFFSKQKRREAEAPLYPSNNLREEKMETEAMKLYEKYWKLYKENPQAFRRILRKGKKATIRLKKVWELYRKDKRLGCIVGELVRLFQVGDNSRTVSSKPVEKEIYCRLPEDVAVFLLTVKETYLKQERKQTIAA
jgi:hypothetical protein